MIEKENQSCNLDDSEKIVTEFDKEPYLSPKRQRAREIAIEKGFINEIHLENWRWFNSLSNAQYSGYEVDILHQLENGISED